MTTQDDDPVTDNMLIPFTDTEKLKFFFVGPWAEVHDQYFRFCFAYLDDSIEVYQEIGEGEDRSLAAMPDLSTWTDLLWFAHLAQTMNSEGFKAKLSELLLLRNETGTGDST